MTSQLDGQLSGLADELKSLLVTYLREAAPAYAKHEAAHVVLAWVLGATVKRATIELAIEDGKTVDGSVTWHPPDGMSIRDRALVTLAGGGPGSAHDEQCARELAAELVEEWRQEARALVAQHGDAVEAVARALLERGTLEKNELEAIRERLGLAGMGGMQMGIEGAGA